MEVSKQGSPADKHEGSVAFKELAILDTAEILLEILRLPQMIWLIKPQDLWISKCRLICRVKTQRDQAGVTKNQPNMGLRQVLGNDPANPLTDYFSLGQGTPQTWEPNNYAAGIAICELRITKASAIQPSTPDQHQMTIPLDYGLSGFVWDQSGNRSVVAGLINPFWICVNMLLRAMGLTAGLEAPLNTQTIVVTLPPSSFFSFSGSTIGDFEIVAFTGNPVGMFATLIACCWTRRCVSESRRRTGIIAGVGLAPTMSNSGHRVRASVKVISSPFHGGCMLRARVLGQVATIADYGSAARF